jgi:hypothetical protein
MLHFLDGRFDGDTDGPDGNGFNGERDGGPRRGPLRQGLLVLALAGLLAHALESVHRTHRKRSDGRPARLPERLQTWEGEGGRPDPDPAVPGAPRAPLSAV